MARPGFDSACSSDPCGVDCYNARIAGGDTPEMALNYQRGQGCAGVGPPAASGQASFGPAGNAAKPTLTFDRSPAAMQLTSTHFLPTPHDFSGGFAGGGVGGGAPAGDGTPVAAGEGMSKGTIAVLGIGAAAAAGLGIYFLTRKKRRGRR